MAKAMDAENTSNECIWHALGPIKLGHWLSLLWWGDRTPSPWTVKLTVLWCDCDRFDPKNVIYLHNWQTNEIRTDRVSVWDARLMCWLNGNRKAENKRRLVWCMADFRALHVPCVHNFIVKYHSILLCWKLVINLRRSVRTLWAGAIKTLVRILVVALTRH